MNCAKILREIDNRQKMDDETFARWLAFFAYEDFISDPTSDYTKELYKRYSKSPYQEISCFERQILFEWYLEDKMDKKQCVKLLGDDYDYGKVFDFYLESKSKSPVATIPTKQINLQATLDINLDQTLQS